MWRLGLVRYRFCRSSEVQLETELNLPWQVDLTERHRAKIRTGRVRDGARSDGRIKHIECFEAKLERSSAL